MIDLDFIESLVRLLDDSSLDSLEIERGGMRVRLAKSPAGGRVVAPPPAAVPVVPERPPAPPTVAPPPAVEDPAVLKAEGPALVEVTSPMVGTFYRAPSPEADPYVSTGDAVSPGDVLCVIEAMKLMNELECETAGRIVEICVANAEPVDYGQLLFRLEPA